MDYVGNFIPAFVRDTRYRCKNINRIKRSKVKDEEKLTDASLKGKWTHTARFCFVPKFYLLSLFHTLHFQLKP